MLSQLHRAPSPDRGRRIWKGLVHYLNADLAADKSAFESLKQVLIHLTYCDWGELELFGEVRKYAKSSGRTLEEAYQFWATRYQADFRNLLTWLCLPNEHSSQLKSQARLFLTLSAHGEDWQIEDDDVLFDQTGNEGYPIFFWKRVEYKSIAAPISKFILNQIERFQDGELDLHQALPVRICGRLGCGKFMLPERSGRKRFCSSLCSALFHQHAKSRDEWRDYIWLHRLESRPSGIVRSKLNQPAVRKRLREIEARWPKLAAKVREIRARNRTGKR